MKVLFGQLWTAWLREWTLFWAARLDATAPDPTGLVKYALKRADMEKT